MQRRAASRRFRPTTDRTCVTVASRWHSGTVRRMEMRLEVVQVPVADVDRSKSFYTEKLGFVLDHDVEYIPGMRVVQLTPPGSAASIVIGTGMTGMPPGSLEGLQLVVPDLAAVRAELLRRGADISEIQDMGGVQFAYFGDPDGTAGLSRAQHLLTSGTHIWTRPRHSRADRWPGSAQRTVRLEPLLAADGSQWWEVAALKTRAVFRSPRVARSAGTSRFDPADAAASGSRPSGRSVGPNPLFDDEVDEGKHPILVDGPEGGVEGCWHVLVTGDRDVRSRRKPGP